MPYDPRDPIDQAMRERSLLRGLWELTPLGGIGKLAREYKGYADRERASGSLMGDYLTALEPVEQIGSDLVKSAQMPLNAIQAGSGAIAGALLPDAYQRSYAERLPAAERQGEFDPLALGQYLESAPGPGDVIAEAVAPDPQTAAGRVAKNIGALAGNVILDPGNLATGGLGAADDAIKAGRYADAAAQILGSPVAGAVYAPDILQTITQGADVALDPNRSVSERLEAGTQAGLAAGLGGLMAHGAISERIALKRQAKAVGLDDVPMQAPQAPPPRMAQEAPEAAGTRREPQPLQYEAPTAPERPPQPVVEEPVAPPQDLGVAEEAARPDIPPEPVPLVEEAPARPVETVQPEPVSTERGQPTLVDESAPTPARPYDPRRYALTEAQARAAESVTERADTEGRGPDEITTEEIAAEHPRATPDELEIIRTDVARRLTAREAGRAFIERAREKFGDVPPDDPRADGVETIAEDADKGHYWFVQRKDGKVIQAGNSLFGIRGMLAGGKALKTGESFRPIYEAMDSLGIKPSDALSPYGRAAQERQRARVSEANPAIGVRGEARTPEGAIAGRGGEGESSYGRATDAGRVPEAPQRPETDQSLESAFDVPTPIFLKKNRYVVDGSQDSAIATHEAFRGTDAEAKLHEALGGPDREITVYRTGDVRPGEYQSYTLDPKSTGYLYGTDPAKPYKVKVGDIAFPGSFDQREVVLRSQYEPTEVKRPKVALLIPGRATDGSKFYTWESPSGRSLSADFAERSEAVANRPDAIEYRDDGHQPLPEDVSSVRPRETAPLLKQVSRSADSLILRFAGREGEAPVSMAEARAIFSDHPDVTIERLGLDTVFDTPDTQKYRVSFGSEESAKRAQSMFGENVIPESRNPLDRNEPLPARQLIDQARLRLAQHERTRAPEATVAHDLGSAVYHVVASGLKKTLPQVRGWIKRHLGTWLRKVGFAGEKLNQAIARAYEGAKTRWAAHQERMRQTFGEPERGSTSAPKRSEPVMSREEIDRQLRSNPELRGMARAQLEAVAQSAGKPMTRINDGDLRKAFPGDDPQSRATRAMLNRVAAAERLAEPVEGGDELTRQLQASLANPQRGRTTLNNPRSQSGKVRETPAPKVEKAAATEHAREIRNETASAEDEARHVESVRSVIDRSNLPTDTKSRLKFQAKDIAKASGTREILDVSELDPGVRAALKIRTNADLSRLVRSGKHITQAEIAAFKLATQSQRAESLKLLDQWRAAKTDAEKAAAQEAYLQSQLTQAENLRAFAGDTVEAARIHRAKQVVGQSDAVKKLFSSLRPQSRELLTPKQAANLATLIDEVMKGKRPSADLADAIHGAIKSDLLDKVLEFVKAGFLSAPPTHMVNAAGNVTSGILDLAKTGFAGLVDPALSRLQGRERIRYASDLGAALTGMRSALPDAMAQFARNLADIATFKPEKFDLNSGMFEYQVGAIPGKIGRVVRTPFRLLQATDGFFRHIFMASEQFKEANRAVERRIEKGDIDRAEKGAFMADWLEKLRDPDKAEYNKDVLARINSEVRKNLFQQEHGSFIKLVQKGTSHGWGRLAQLKLPFIGTPSNVIRTMFKYSPPGMIEAGNRLRANDPATRMEALDDFAKGAVGTAVTAGLMTLASQGLITGTGPDDPKKKAQLMQTGWRPQSLKIGDKYIPLDKLEPFGTLLGISADLVEARDEASAGEAFGKSVQIIKDNVVDKSWFQGLGEIIKFVGDPVRNSERFIASTAGSFVPNLSSRIAQGMDPIYRDTKGEGHNPIEKILDASYKNIKSRIPGLSEDLKARKTVTGEDMTRGGTVLSRVFLPSQISEESKTPDAAVIRELLRLSYSPPPPQKFTKVDGRKIEWTDEEYKRLEDAKQSASEEAYRVMQQPSYQSLPDTVEEGGQASKEAVIRRIYQGYQERARHDLYRTDRLRKERRKAEAARMPNVRIQYRDR